MRHRRVTDLPCRWDGIRSSAALLPLLVAVALLAGCGGGGGSTMTTVRPPIVAINPVAHAKGVDPDAEQRSSTEVSVSVSSRGTGHYQVLVQNTSQIGFINSFEWFPPPGLTITSVTSSSAGQCELQGNVIACRATLPPPKCTCLPGGAMTVDFAAKMRGVGKIQYGFRGASVVVRSMTPVPYIIPSRLGAHPEYADLPICKTGQQSSQAEPCIHSTPGPGK
jgi:hypothetical protein